MGELGLLGELCYFSPVRGCSMKGEMGGEGTLGRHFSWSLDFILRAASVVMGLPECGQRGRPVIRALLAPWREGCRGERQRGGGDCPSASPLRTTGLPD